MRQPSAVRAFEAPRGAIPWAEEWRQDGVFWIEKRADTTGHLHGKPKHD